MDSWLIFRRNSVSAHHFSSRPDCNNTADVPSFTLRTALSTIPFVSDLCGVDVQWFQERSSHALQMTLGFLFGSKNFGKLLLCFLRSFCFARMRLDPLGGQVLHHDCISMIVSRITTFNENFVIWCSQITKIFCTKYDSTNTSSAVSFCDFGPLANLAISVFQEVSINTVFTEIRTSRKCKL